MKRLALVLAFAGCYSPEIGDCQYLCDFSAEDPSKVCPEGMFCSEDSFCVTDPSFNCGFPPPPPPDADGPVDEGVPQDTPQPMGDGGSMPDAVPPADAAPSPSEPAVVELDLELSSIREHLDDVTVER